MLAYSGKETPTCVRTREAIVRFRTAGQVLELSSEQWQTGDCDSIGPGMGDQTVRQSMAPERGKTLLFFCFAIALASIASAQYGNQSRGVTLYRDLNFSGTSQTFSDDIPDLRGSYVGNDNATSVRISSGCRARLYADVDYRGAYIEVERDVSDLRRSPVGNDTVTSLRVRCEGSDDGWSDGGAWPGGGTSRGVTVYRDLNFSGASQSFSDDVADLRSTFVGNDTATSVRVERGCRARLYADADYRGDHIEVDQDISDLRGSPVGNDTVTSMQVRCEETGGGWGGGDSGWGSSNRVTLYEDTNFRGTAYSFDSDVGDLRSTFGANDEASSVRVAPGCVVRLYPDPQFRGNYTETRGDISDLRGSQVGNDSISSFQVRCQ